MVRYDKPGKILIIHNPAAGQKTTKLFGRTLALLRASSSQIDIKETRASGHGRAIARTYKNGPYDKICAAGGDGTINEVLNGLYPSALPLGIIPLGTANVLAKEILPDEKAETIAKTILDGTAKDCWLGKIQDQYFSLMVSMGPDAQAVIAVNLSLKKIIGKAAYALAFLKQILCYRPIVYQVTIDGKAHPASAVIISKGQFYGGAYVSAPDGDIGKRAFQVLLFQNTGRFAALGYALKMIRGKIPYDKSVTIRPGTNITVSADHPACYQKDGEPGGQLPITITLSDAPLSLLTLKDTCK